MRLNKVSVIVFLGLLVVALVSVNVFLYSSLQYKDSFNEKEKLVALEVRTLNATLIYVSLTT